MQQEPLTPNDQRHHVIVATSSRDLTCIHGLGDGFDPLDHSRRSRRQGREPTTTLGRMRYTEEFQAHSATLGSSNAYPGLRPTAGLMDGYKHGGGPEGGMERDMGFFPNPYTHEVPALPFLCATCVHQPGRNH